LLGGFRLPVASSSLVVLVLVALAIATGCGRDEPPPRTGAQPAGNTTRVYERDAAANPLALRIKAAQPPAPKPTTLMPLNTTCITADCHTNYALATRLHGPLSEGRCDSCHDPDAGGHTFPLKRDGNALCTFCHNVSGTQTHQHAALADPGCLGCHKPHAGDHKFLLTHDTIGQLCASCHDIPLRQVAHAPFLNQQCEVCHFPHQSNAKGLLRGGEGSAHCLACHEGIEQHMAAATVKHEPLNEGCLGCHNPHSTDHRALLTASVFDNCASCHQESAEHASTAKVAHGAATDDRACANCHNPHGSTLAHLLADREDRLCMQCHDKAIVRDGRTIVAAMAAELARPHLHGPVETGDCSGCHDGHGAAHANLLRQPFPDRFYAAFDKAEYDLCFQCHNAQLATEPRTETVTAFRDGDVNLHHLHVSREGKGRTCKACHATHGSGQPHHIAESVPFEGSDWALPIRFEKTVAGGSCAPGCHKPYAYSRDMPLIDRALLKEARP
jgi:predicted CXXCH cytochrome family protein